MPYTYNIEGTQTPDSKQETNDMNAKKLDLWINPNRELYFGKPVKVEVYRSATHNGSYWAQLPRCPTYKMRNLNSGMHYSSRAEAHVYLLAHGYIKVTEENTTTGRA